MNGANSLLLFRPRPQPDELLSSWVVRLAWANHEKVHAFSRIHLGRDVGMWIVDPDRTPRIRVLVKLSHLTGVDRPRIWDTTLAAHEGVLFERRHPSGSLDWVVPKRKVHKCAREFSLAYCPVCLKSDDQPYFRREWRLGWAVACPLHGCRLLDACPDCGACVAFQFADRGRSVPRQDQNLAVCWRCGQDLADADPGSALPPEASDLVSILHNATTGDETPEVAELPVRALHPLALFQGLHVLMHAISSEAKVMPLLAGIRALPRHPDITLPQGQGRPFEERQLHERAMMVETAAWLLRDWPERFIAACRAAKLMGSAFRYYRKADELPFWLEEALRNGIDRPWYRVTRREVQSAQTYLLRRWMKPTFASLSKLLGHTVQRPRS